MLKIIITHCLLVFFLSFANAQNYNAYHDLTNQAKLKAATGLYAESTNLFEQAFLQYDFRFARDCYNALEVSFFHQNNSQVRFFLTCCAKAGIPLDFLNDLKAIQQMKKMLCWKDIQIEMQQARLTYEQTINWKLRQEINQMFTEDQRIRKRYYKWNNFLFRPFIKNKWKKLNESQVQRIKEITATHGFPGEKLIGIDRPEDHDKIAKNQCSAGMPIVILIHYFSDPKAPISQTLSREVEKGNLWPRHLGVIADFEHKYGDNSECASKPFGCYFLSPAEDKDQLNARRTDIGLMTLSEMNTMRRAKCMTKFYLRLY